ncbi:MAG: S41 family peptidase [Bacteroidales bacterium]|jgi:carboxyl-terminal processing protease|nr:S41 family peptidase [Bacteroidales bacterium]MDD2263343.1 S41 family peptidase [Bacteroidales bacterium]MDD2830867.1 S41 family peptidase [Bacteroidales bacterium]MDD3208066.1 S41 family peptidase [Bacteroidales bacterium]MDD3696427.1 S41 family peptidase [Bacteroidales bacterium]
MKIKAILLALFLPLLLTAQSAEFNTSKSLDIFHSLLREISLYYVDSVALDQLVYTGIEAMLSTMDPYTEFIPEENNESIEIMTTGSYGGIGALIKKSPGEGVLISEPYTGSPAVRAGLIAGDMILAIDGEFVRDLSADECSSRMKGTPGTEVELLVRRLMQRDTVSIKVVREKVHISDVGLACMLRDSIAYIRMTGFTQGGAADARKVLKKMKKDYPVKGIVLDLRGNGGGLMDEAVKLLSIFLPKNTMVVSARGRLARFDVEHYTKEEPLDTRTPLVVLVNKGSASSSEIVAGAIQDLKRGVIVGEKTFGKGLVQTIRPLSYNANLKITTAKYYIPSGRCVQALDYGKRNGDGTPERNENGGIVPDSVVTLPMYSRIAMELVTRDYLHEYSIRYFTRHKTILPAEAFYMTDEDYNDFVQLTAAKEFDDRSATEILLETFSRTAEAEGYEGLLKKEITALRERLLTDKAKDLMHYRKEIQPLLEEEICCRYYLQEGRLRSMIRDDLQLEKALSVLTKKR